MNVEEKHPDIASVGSRAGHVIERYVGIKKEARIRAGNADP